MRIPGQRIHRTRLVQTGKYVVAVDVEMVIPTDDPTEPCYEPETLQYLQEVREHVQRDDVDWLTTAGKVYVAINDGCSDMQRRKTTSAEPSHDRL